MIAIGKDDYIALERNTSRDPDDPPVFYRSRDNEDIQLAILVEKELQALQGSEYCVL